MVVVVVARWNCFWILELEMKLVVDEDLDDVIRLNVKISVFLDFEGSCEAHWFKRSISIPKDAINFISFDFTRWPGLFEGIISINGINIAELLLL